MEMKIALGYAMYKRRLNSYQMSFANVRASFPWNHLIIIISVPIESSASVVKFFVFVSESYNLFTRLMRIDDL